MLTSFWTGADTKWGCREMWLIFYKLENTVFNIQFSLFVRYFYFIIGLFLMFLIEVYVASACFTTHTLSINCQRQHTGRQMRTSNHVRRNEVFVTVVITFTKLQPLCNHILVFPMYGPLNWPALWKIAVYYWLWFCFSCQPCDLIVCLPACGDPRRLAVGRGIGVLWPIVVKIE